MDKFEYVVKITRDNDGSVIKSPRWCYTTYQSATRRTLCDGQAIGIGDSAVEYDQRPLKHGSITCKFCLNIIREFKKIPL